MRPVGIGAKRTVETFCCGPMLRNECARLFAADMPVMLCRWIIIQTLTGGRPQTAVDLRPLQCNRDSGVVDLNPFHRTQNKKHRAKVKAGRVLRFFLKRWEKTGLGPFGDRYCGYETMEGVKSGVQRVAAETGKRLASGRVRPGNSVKCPDQAPFDEQRRDCA